jgi:acyl-[acyl carrier protein]--UDP-N-acetylglucosamine O-acyltransferase
MEIHPTAIINSAAEISDGVKIGPYVCIDGPATIGPDASSMHTPSSWVP